MVVLLSVLGLLGLCIGCVILLRYQAPWRRIARDRRRESIAYKLRMEQRHGVQVRDADG